VSFFFFYHFFGVAITSLANFFGCPKLLDEKKIGPRKIAASLDVWVAR